MAIRGLTSMYDELADSIVKADVQLARAIKQAGARAVRGRTSPGGVKLYLLGLAIENRLPKPTRKPRARPRSRTAE